MWYTVSVRTDVLCVAPGGSSYPAGGFSVHGTLCVLTIDRPQPVPPGLVAPGAFFVERPPATLTRNPVLLKPLPCPATQRLTSMDAATLTPPYAPHFSTQRQTQADAPFSTSRYPQTTTDFHIQSRTVSEPPLQGGGHWFESSSAHFGSEARVRSYGDRKTSSGWRKGRNATLTPPYSAELRFCFRAEVFAGDAVAYISSSRLAMPLVLPGM